MELVHEFSVPVPVELLEQFVRNLEAGVLGG